jgi:PAS domain S-box-containing protein
MNLDNRQAGIDGNLQERLVLAQRRFSNLIKSLPMSIAIVDSQGQVEADSPRLRALLGYEEGELVAKNVSMLLANAPWKNSSFEQWRFENPEITIELQACAKDGERIVVDFSVRQLEQDSRGRHVVIIQDVSERFLANKLKQEFFQMINHDIRAPLAAVATFLESLKESSKYGTLSDLGVERLSLAMLNVDRIMTLASGILELSGLESGAVLKRQEVGTNEMVMTALASVRELADAKQIKLASLVEDLVLIADRVRLIQVIVNLLANAIEHSPAGMSIELNAKKSGPSFSVSIRDYGPGIPEGEKLMIFERFRQGSGGRSTGYGLGLSISNQIVKQHGGTICGTDAEGGGSVFSFTIPIKAPGDSQCS